MLAIKTQLEEKNMEMSGFEPEASYMRSKRSTTELHPHDVISALNIWPSQAIRARLKTNN